jgi:hypothetical protein
LKTEQLSTLIINKLSQAQYDEALANNEINDNEIYLIPDDHAEVTELGKRVAFLKTSEGTVYDWL